MAMASESSAKPTPQSSSTPAQSKRPILNPKCEFEGHEDTIWCFVFLHDSVHIVSGSEDGTMRQWNCDTGLVAGEPWKGEGGSVYALALSPDGKTIACGREDGSVQRWTTDGEMIEGIWTGHSNRVRSLSWSPSGDHLASGSGDGTILIRKAESGEVMVGPIDTEQIGVWSLAYSPSGERIASGGWNKSICIWNTKTGKLVVGPIEDVGNSTVTSLAWSSDSSKLYSASNKFSRVFDSKSGKLIHRFQHEHSLYAVALLPQINVLACVGYDGVAQLWDTDSLQPLSQSLHQEHEWLYWASFSRNGRYLACGGRDGTIALWIVKDIAPELAVPIPQQGGRQATQQQLRPESPTFSFLDVDATRGDDIMAVHDDPYHKFFESSQASLTSPSSDPHLSRLFSIRRFWNIVSRQRPLADESVPQERLKHSFFARRAHSKLSLKPAIVIPSQPSPDRKDQAGQEGEEGPKDDSLANPHPELGASEDNQPDESLADAQTIPPADPTSHAKLNSGDHNLWKRLIHARRKDPASANAAPAKTRPEVVVVYAVRSFQRFVAWKPKRKTKSPAVMCSAPPSATHASGSSEPANVIATQSPPDGKVQAGEEGEEGENLGFFTNLQPELGTNTLEKNQDEQQEGSLTNAQSPPPTDPALHANLHSDDNHSLWKQLMRGRPKDTKMAPASKRPEVVEVCAVRGFQRYVARTPKHKTMRSVVTHSTPLAATHTRGSSSTGLSSRDSTIQLGASPQAVSKQGRPSSPAMVGHGTQYSQAVGGSSFHASPSHFVTTYHATHNSDSDSIHGSCNKLLDKICFPCGHYYEDS